MAIEKEMDIIRYHYMKMGTAINNTDFGMVKFWLMCFVEFLDILTLLTVPTTFIIGAPLNLIYIIIHTTYWILDLTLNPVLYPLRLETLVLVLHWLGYDSSTYVLIEKFIRLQYENLPNDP